MNLVGFQCYSHFVDGFYPLPNRLWVLVIEIFSDELLRLVFLALPFKLLIIEAVLSSEGRNPTWSRYSSASDDQNILIFQHAFYQFFEWDLLRKMLIYLSFYFFEGIGKGSR